MYNYDTNLTIIIRYNLGSIFLMHPVNLSRSRSRQVRTADLFFESRQLLFGWTQTFWLVLNFGCGRNRILKMNFSRISTFGPHQLCCERLCTLIDSSTRCGISFVEGSQCQYTSAVDYDGAILITYWLLVLDPLPHHLRSLGTIGT